MAITQNRQYPIPITKHQYGQNAKELISLTNISITVSGTNTA